MAAVYIAKTYGRKAFKWAIAGRRQQALLSLRTELAAIDPNLASLPFIVADSNDELSLRDLAVSTKVVITTAGPYGKYGSLLVKQCAINGTHYCDITGETDWVREMIDKYNNTAVRSGARIVHFCGHDCVPWDLCVLILSSQLKKKNANEFLTEVSEFISLLVLT